MTLIWPNYIAPLFNQFKELDHPEVRDSINALLKDVGFKSSGVYVMDGSKRSTHGNAYFTGFGSTKRIVLFDTLMERLTSSEIRAVLAHELGHFKLNHIRKGLILNLIIMGLGFWVLGQLSQNEAFFQALHLPVRPAVVLILCIQGVSVISWPLGPLMNALSRAHEFEADAYAARHAPANDLIVALTKLVKDNASTLTPDRWYSRFFASHPTVTERIAALKTTP
jgi:STE24 endopeptidase